MEYHNQQQADLTRSMINTSIVANIHPKQLLIKNGLLIIDNYVCHYQSQVIYDNTKLYLPQLNKSVIIDQKLLAYDQQYFSLCLKKQLLQQLQCLDASTSLKIIQNMPQMKQDDYFYLFQNLSLEKIEEILLNDQFYIYLLVNLQKIVYNNQRIGQYQAQYLQKYIICNMSLSIYQRLQYLLSNLEGVDSKIRSALENIANKLILNKINQNNFMKNLSRMKQTYNRNQISISNTYVSTSKFNIKFIDHITNLLSFMQYITNHQFDQNLQTQYTLQTSIIHQLIFNKQCINIISTNFNQMLTYNRKKLLLILCLIVKTGKNIDIWSQIILHQYEMSSYENKLGLENDKYDKLHKNNDYDNDIDKNSTKIMMNNKTNFKNLIMNSHLKNNHEHSNISLYLIQQISTSKNCIGNPSFQLVLSIYQQIKDLGIDIEQIDIITTFIIQHRSKIQQNSKFRLFISHYLQSLYSIIQRQYKKYQQKKMKLTNSQLNYTNKKKTNKIYKIIRCNSKMICFLLQSFSKMFQKQILTNFNDQYLIYIQKLLEMSNGKGIIDGIKRHFIKIVKQEYIKQSQKKIEKKKINNSHLGNYHNKNYSLNQKKSSQTTLQKLMKIIQNHLSNNQ